MNQNPEDFEGNRMLAETYEKSGRLSDALAIYRKLDVLDSDNLAAKQGTDRVSAKILGTAAPVAAKPADDFEFDEFSSADEDINPDFDSPVETEAVGDDTIPEAEFPDIEEDTLEPLSKEEENADVFEKDLDEEDEAFEPQENDSIEELARDDSDPDDFFSDNPFAYSADNASRPKEEEMETQFLPEEIETEDEKKSAVPECAPQPVAEPEPDPKPSALQLKDEDIPAVNFEDEEESEEVPEAQFIEEEEPVEEEVPEADFGDEDAAEVQPAAPNLIPQELIDETARTFESLAEAMTDELIAQKFGLAASLFKKLRALIEYLPAEQKDEFLQSNTRLQLDYIISRLSGRRGLLAAADILRKKNKISETEGSVTDSGRALLVSVLGNSLKLVRNLPDRNMAGALSEKIEDILERLR